MKRIYLFINYLKRRFKTSSSDQSDILLLTQEMKHVQNLIDAAENNFNNVTDSDSIDYYVYILKAYRVRYNKLVKELKNIAPY